jgi:GntR family transcriptional regulator
MSDEKPWALEMDAGPIFEQIGTNVRRLLARGELRPGEKLPSARDLAEALSVNPNTVVHAYAELESQGIIEKRRGLGTFVREDAPVKPMKAEMLKASAKAFVNDVAALGVDRDEASAAVKEAWDAGEPR